MLSGSREALQTCAERLSQRGIAVRELAVEYAFHSAQMAPFVSGIVAALQNVRPLPASIPIASTVSGRWASTDDFNAAYWGRNVREPVRFAPAIAQLLQTALSTSSRSARTPHSARACKRRPMLSRDSDARVVTAA